MTGVVIKHGAVLQRCWLIRPTPGGFYGVLHSRPNGEDARTEVGSLYLVLDAIDHCYAHRGAPVFRTPVQAKGERVAT